MNALTASVIFIIMTAFVLITAASIDRQCKPDPIDPATLCAVGESPIYQPLDGGKLMHVDCMREVLNDG